VHGSCQPQLCRGVPARLVLESRPQQVSASELVVQIAALGIDIESAGEGRVREIESLEANFQVGVHCVARRSVEPRTRVYKIPKVALRGRACCQKITAV